MNLFSITKPEMSADAVVALYQKFQQHHIKVWIDGGWGVDALLGVQTRPHQDLDIVVQQKDLKLLCDVLIQEGYKTVPRDDTRAWNFVLGDQLGHLIDIHVIVLDKSGNGIYGPIEYGHLYPAAALIGSGQIQNYPVQCISLEWALKFHTGYPLREIDFKDVDALCRKFAQAYPTGYESLDVN